MGPERCQALIRTRQWLCGADWSANIWSYYSRLVSAIRWLHNLNMINLAGCELCSCNHKIRWHFCFLVERKHYICASHNFITVAFGKKELCQLKDAIEKKICVCVSVQYKCLKRQSSCQSSPWEILLCGFCFSSFFLCTHQFWGQEVGKLGAPLEPSWDNTALLWHIESHRESAGYSSAIAHHTPFIKPHCSVGTWATT